MPGELRSARPKQIERLYRGCAMCLARLLTSSFAGWLPRLCGKWFETAIQPDTSPLVRAPLGANPLSPVRVRNLSRNESRRHAGEFLRGSGRLVFRLGLPQGQQRGALPG